MIARVNKSTKHKTTNIEEAGKAHEWAVTGKIHIKAVKYHF